MAELALLIDELARLYPTWGASKLYAKAYEIMAKEAKK